MSTESIKKRTKLDRIIITEEHVDFVCDMVRGFIKDRMIDKGAGSFASRHEILGCVTEEYKELLDAVHCGSNDEIKAELLDVACSCLFGYASIDFNGTEW